MFDFDILEKGLRIVFLLHFENYFSRKMVLMLHVTLTDQILLSDSLYFLRNWTKCVLQLFVNHVVTS